MQIPPDATDEQIDELNQKQIFVRDALPVEWLTYAEELGEAAEALWLTGEDSMRLELTNTLTNDTRIKKSPGHRRSYVLLAGLALENAIKGMLIMRNPMLVNQGHLHGDLRNHDLLSLMSDVKDFPISDDEHSVLLICQDAIPYWGRYPVPLKYAHLSPTQAVTTDFRKHFRDFHYRLCNELYQCIKDGWDSGVGPQTMHVRNARYGDKIEITTPLPRVDQRGK